MPWDDRIDRSSEKIEFSDRAGVWTADGIKEAVKILLQKQNPLFESLTRKLNDYPELKRIVFRLLFQGKCITYSPDDPAIQMTLSFGFVKIENSQGRYIPAQF